MHPRRRATNERTPASPRWLAASIAAATAMAIGAVAGCSDGGCRAGEKVSCTCGGGVKATVICADDGSEPPCLCGNGGVDGGSTASGELDWSQDDAVVSNAKAGLMWQRVPLPFTMAWEPAKIACEELELAGYADWLLPHRDDLLTIVLKSTTTPAIDTAAFPNTASKPFWSRTLYAPQAKTHAWGVDFEDGGEGYAPFIELHHVRCVRVVAP